MRILYCNDWTAKSHPGKRIDQDIHERLLAAVVSKQDNAASADEEVLAYMIAALARNDRVRPAR